jgi:hypothetical protein
MGGRLCGERVERDAVAELFELAGEPADGVVWAFAALEVVEAEVAVGLCVVEDVVGADEDRVGHGDDRFAVTAAAAEV